MAKWFPIPRDAQNLNINTAYNTSVLHKMVKAIQIKYEKVNMNGFIFKIKKILTTCFV